jgi:hypothetical protein
METLKLLLPLLSQSENSGMFVVSMMMLYVYIKHFLPHAAESALKKHQLLTGLFVKVTMNGL